jgi:hypothetical protein
MGLAMGMETGLVVVERLASGELGFNWHDLG